MRFPGILRVAESLQEMWTQTGEAKMPEAKTDDGCSIYVELEGPSSTGSAPCPCGASLRTARYSTMRRLILSRS